MIVVVPYNSYRASLKKKFNGDVLKITINGGFSCPNRDGTIAIDGCTFCDNRSFSPVAQRSDSPSEQLLRAISRTRHRCSHYIAYLQPFTNTYAPVATLRSVYEPLIAIPDVVGLAIGTRPDCIDESVVEYLGELAERTYLTLELGLQSADNAVLSAAKRGHTVEQFIDAVELLRKTGVEIVAHVMLGLPKETVQSRRKTAMLLASLPVSGIKIHQLMIIKETALETMYLDGSASVLSIDDYACYLGEFLELIRPDQQLHRIVADSTIKNGLVAPLWSADKNRALSYIHDYLVSKSIVQGCRFERVAPNF